VNNALPLYYLPPISWWIHYYHTAVLKKEKVTLCYPSLFVKHRYFHRCDVKGTQGKFVLSVPIEHGSMQKGFSVQTDEKENWRWYHLKVFQNYYRKAPFFEDLFPLLKRGLSVRGSLYEMNCEFIQSICELLGLPLPDAIVEVPYPELRKKWNSPFSFQMEVYPQFYGPFIPDLSIVDLLMQEGLDSRYYFLKTIQKSDTVQTKK